MISLFKPRAVQPQLRLDSFRHIQIDRAAGFCVLDGMRYRILAGAWSCFIPDLRLKLIFARDGHLHCASTRAPKSVEELSPEQDYGIYTADDWRRALTSSVFERAAENLIASQRLGRAGLGPDAFGLCTVADCEDDTGLMSGPVAGFYVDDARQLPKKSDATEQQMLDAGVNPDQLKACIRQQVRGYIVDLNSVVGAAPIDADEQVQQLSQMMQQQMALSHQLNTH